MSQFFGRSISDMSNLKDSCNRDFLQRLRQCFQEHPTEMTTAECQKQASKFLNQCYDPSNYTRREDSDGCDYYIFDPKLD